LNKKVATVFFISVRRPTVASAAPLASITTETEFFCCLKRHERNERIFERCRPAPRERARADQNTDLQVFFTTRACTIPSAGKKQVPERVARWFLSKPKIPIWVNLGGPLNAKCVYILWPFGIFYRNLGYFMTIWYILCSFGKFFRFWYIVSRKIWQPWFQKLSLSFFHFLGIWLPVILKKVSMYVSHKNMRVKITRV
jgi:hypothetical protein